MVASIGPALAVPVLKNSGSFGGSDYELYLDHASTWTSVGTFATTLSHGFVSGHLAAITTAVENRFLKTLIAGVDRDRRPHR